MGIHHLRILIQNLNFLRKNGPKAPPPFGLKIFKGYKNVMMRRDFVDFIINHPVAKVYRDYVKTMAVPDEHFYATLSRIQNIDYSNAG